MKRIEYYRKENGRCPYTEWLNSLSYENQRRIIKRVKHIYEGNFGDWGHIQNSKLCEMRFFFGSGYRIYYKEIDETIVLFLAGSDKSDQNRVIEQANKYYDDYIKRNNKNGK